MQIIIIILVVAADLISKYLLTSLIQQAGGTIPLIQDVFHLTYVQNTGASFGIFQNQVTFFVIATSIVLIVGIVFMIRTRKTQSRFMKISLSLVLGGAIGNFYDRIVFGYVRDLLDFRLFDFWRWVFNVADACLVIGAIMLGVYVLFIYREKDGKSLFAKREKKPNNLEESQIDQKEKELDGKLEQDKNEPVTK